MLQNTGNTGKYWEIQQNAAKYCKKTGKYSKIMENIAIFRKSYGLNHLIREILTLWEDLEALGGALKVLVANYSLFFAIVAEEKDSVESSYTAKDLAVLEGLEAVRKRPGMYIGSTDSRGLMHCLWEIIDNAVDEALGGHCKKIEINLAADCLFSPALQTQDLNDLPETH